MKNLLFRVVGFLMGSLIGINVAVGNAVAVAVEFVFGSINQALAWLARTMLRAIDKQRHDYIESVLGQTDELRELDLMMAASRVKESALEARVWTAMHTLMMNKIGTALHHNCGWEIPRIHQYLRDVVESIPGMVYTAGDDFPEDA